MKRILISENIYRLLLAVYIIALPITHAFSVSKWLPVPLLVMFVFFVIYLLEVACTGKVLNIFQSSQGKLLLMFLASLSLASIVNIDIFGIKQFNHLLSYIVVAAAYYFGALLLIKKSKASFSNIVLCLTIAVVFASIFGIVEFLGKNVLNYDVDRYVPRITGFEYNPTYVGHIIRARSFMAESGNFALFLELFSPLIIIYWFRSGKVMLGTVLLIIITASLATTFSAAAVAAISFGFLVAFIVYISTAITEGKVSRRSLKVLPFGLLGIITVFFLGSQNIDNNYVADIANKLTFTYSYVDDPGSRLSRWRGVLPNIKENPIFGLGPGGFLNSEGSDLGIVSWWLQIVVEGGFVSASIFFIFYLSIFTKILNATGMLKYAYIISISAGAAHYGVISDYWLPWIWFLFNVVTMDVGQLDKVSNSRSFSSISQSKPA